MKTTIIIVAVVLGLGIAVYAITTGNNNANDNANQSADTSTGGGPMISFLDCEDTGYDVAESYPRTCTGPDGEVFTEDIGNEIAKADLIKIASPRPNGTIVSPITITGEAVGSWYFEGEFSIFLYDVLGNEIGRANADAQGEWMTENFVDFSASMTFDNEASGPGELQLVKSNPSDIGDFDDALVVPVDFGPYAD